jgi:surface polysaccharide O-acyltransferase-like enzyme
MVPMLFPFIGLISDVAEEFANNCYKEFGIKIASGHVGYFVLGQYLANYNIKETVKRIICILGLLSVLAVSILTFFASIRVGAPYLSFYDYINLFTLFEAVALFIVIKDIKVAPKYHPFLKNASKLSLGIYIIHPLVMNVLFDYGDIDSASLNPINFIPLFALMVFMISYCVSFVLIRIPIIKKFLM